MRLKNAFNNIFLRIRIGLVLLIGIGMSYFSYAADELQSVVPLHTFTEHTGWVYSVSFSPGGQTLASGSDDGTVRLWDVNTGNLLHTLTEHRESVYSVSFSPGGQTLASGGGDGTVRLWDVNTGKHLRALIAHPRNADTPITWPRYVKSVHFSPDGQLLASGMDENICLWDANTGEPLHILIGHTRDVESVSFSPDGRMLASAGGDEDWTIRLWDANTGKHRRTLTVDRGWGINNARFSPDSQTLASNALVDGEIRLWNVNTGTPLHTLTEHTGWVYSVSFSPDGRTFASGSGDGTIRLWDANTGKHRRTLTGHTWAVKSICFSPDGQTLASGSFDCTVLLWKLVP